MNSTTANERHSEHCVDLDRTKVAATRAAPEERKVRRLGKLLLVAILPMLAILSTDLGAHTALGGTIPVIDQRISPWAEENNIDIKELGESPIPNDAETVYLLKDVFTTINGSWEVTGERWSVPQWARDDYLAAEFDDAGGDHHLFAAVLGEDGEFVKLKEIVYWSDGFENVNNPDYDNYVYRSTKEHSGWINIPIFSGSSYVPERGESGPWCWMPTDGSETICGGGLPSNHHVSTFAVWQAVPANVPTPILGASPHALSEIVDQGQTAGPFSIELTNVASDVEIPFSYAVGGDPDWITIVASSDHTPATLKVHLDATKLPAGDYQTAIEIEAESDNTVEPNLSIPISLTVEPALVAAPNTALFVYESCEDDLTSRSQQIRVSGPAGGTVTANVVALMSSADSVPWVTVAPATFELPSVTTVTVDPKKREADFEQAMLVLAEQGGGELKLTIPIYFVCASRQIYLPLVAN